WGRGSSCRDIGLLEKEIQFSSGPEKGPSYPDPFPFWQRLPLLLVLLPAHILLAGVLLVALVLLVRLASLLALLLARLLTGFGLVLPLLLLTGLTRRLARRLARLAALVIRHSQSPPGWFSQPEA
ncbi:MAG: hypothetical protein ACRD4I_18035, partial [Candidatus Angelobacter sp.]